jgi:hypothetical protein
MRLASTVSSAFHCVDKTYNQSMSILNKIIFVAKDAAEFVVKAFYLQVERLVRLVTKPPKKPPLSWDSIIGETQYKDKRSSVIANKQNLGLLPKTNWQLLELPTDIFEELLRRLQANLIDEIQAIRLYEKLFDCEVLILRGHVHFYQCTNDVKKETIDYSTLCSRLIQLFLEHHEAISAKP